MNINFESAPADRIPLDPGSWNRDPQYIDNVLSCTYDVLTGYFEVQHQVRGAMQMDYRAIHRQLGTTPLPGPPITGAVSLSIQVYYRSMRDGLIRPGSATRETLPNFARFVEQIERQRGSHEREIILSLIDGAVAVRGVASGAVISGQAAAASAPAQRAVSSTASRTRTNQQPSSTVPNRLQNLTIEQINATITPQQRALLNEFFGRGIEGARARANSFQIPQGLTRDTLEAYREIARRYISGPGRSLNVGAPGDAANRALQTARIELLDRALRWLSIRMSR